MLPESQRKTNVGVGIGTVLQVAGFLLAQGRDVAAIVGLVLILISIPLFIWGCMNYGEGKGHSKWVGLVGLAGVIGLIVLLLLPEQDRDGSIHRPQVRKLVGSISILLGVGITALGRWLDDLDYASIHTGDHIPLEHPWPLRCIFLGVCVTLGGLVLLTGDSRRDVVDRQPEVLANDKDRR